MTLVGCGMGESEALEYVTSVRRGVLGDLEERIYGLEGRIAACLSGPIVIPAEPDALRDAWDELRQAAGRWISNFTVDGERMFKAAGDGDALECFLHRYVPGEPNVNDAVRMLGADMAQIVALRRQRTATSRTSGTPSRIVAGDPYESAALRGSLEQAALEVREVDEEHILAGHYAELDEWGDVIAVTFEPDCGTNVDMLDRVDITDADPVGIKEVGDRLGVARRTVDQWLQRKLLPAPQWTVGGRPAWNWPEIEAWARESGRL